MLAYLITKKSNPCNYILPKIPNAIVVRPRQRPKPFKIIPLIKNNSKMANPLAVGRLANSGVRILLNTPKACSYIMGQAFEILLSCGGVALLYRISLLGFYRNLFVQICVDNKQKNIQRDAYIYELGAKQAHSFIC